eukprot:s2191_g11.t1
MALWNSNPYLLIQDSRAKKGPGDRSDDLSPRGFRLTRSEEIGRNHGLGESVQTLLPRLYCDPLKRLGTSIKLNYQPFMKDLPELMEFHKQRKPQFDEKVAVAKKTNGKAIILMKGEARCKSKAAFKYTDATGTSWHRCTDIGPPSSTMISTACTMAWKYWSR